LDEKLIHLTYRDAVAFMVGATLWFEMNLVGKLFLGELFLLVIAAWFIFGKLRDALSSRFVRLFLIGCAVYLGAQIGTDLYRGISFENYSRGWARIVFLFTNTVGLFAIGYKRPLRLLLWTAGTVLSLWINFVLQGGYAALGWKFGLSVPLTMTALLLVTPRPKLSYLLWLVALGTLNLLMDYRSMALFLFVIAFSIYIRKRYGRYGKGWLGPKHVLVMLLLAVTYGFFYFTSDRFQTEVRREDANAIRMAGFVMGFRAIADSPIIGRGSWAEDRRLFSIWVYEQYKLGSTIRPGQFEQRNEDSGLTDVLQGHSQIVQGWIEAGVVGGLFFILVLIYLVRVFKQFVLSYRIDRFFVITCYVVISAVWAIVLSPFAGGSRIGDAMALSFMATYAHQQRRSAHLSVKF